MTDIALSALGQGLAQDGEGRKSSDGVYDVLSRVDAVLGAGRGKVDRPDAFPLGASIQKENTKASVRTITQCAMYNVQQTCN